MGINKDGSCSAVVVIAASLMPVRPARNKNLPGSEIHRPIVTAGRVRKPVRGRHEHV